MSTLVIRARLTLPIVLTCVAITFAVMAPSGKVLGAIAFVGGLLFGAWASSRPRVVVDDRGVAMRRLLGWVQIGWEDIDRYHYWAGMLRTRRDWTGAAARSRAERDPHRCFESAALRLIAGDGRRVEFGPGVFFARAPVAEAFERVLAEVHRRLLERADLTFAPIRIHDGQLEWPNALMPLPLTSVDRIAIADGLDGVQVFRSPGPFSAAAHDRPWATMRQFEIANLWLLVDRLRSHGISVDVDAGVFIPGYANLPTARVVAAGQ